MLITTLQFSLNHQISAPHLEEKLYWVWLLWLEQGQIKILDQSQLKPYNKKKMLITTLKFSLNPQIFAPQLEEKLYWVWLLWLEQGQIKILDQSCSTQLGRFLIV